MPMASVMFGSLVSVLLVVMMVVLVFYRNQTDLIPISHRERA
jgi:hypothetical protein